MADLWTDKQRRWFWYAWKEGLIELPYRRTFRLADAVSFRIVVQGYEAYVYLEVDEAKAPYAKWVLGPEQSEYFEFRTRWPKFQKLAEEVAPDIANLYNEIFATANQSLTIYDPRAARLRSLGSGRFTV